MNTNDFDLVLQNKSTKDYKFRRLEEFDYDKGYFELLSQLTIAEKCNIDQWKERFDLIKNFGNIDIIAIVEEKTGSVVGSITLIFEPKFIRKMGYVCHIEDFVIDANHRNNKLGKVMIEISIAFSKLKNCYKIILDCDEKVQKFYEKSGFVSKSKGMALYL